MIPRKFIFGFTILSLLIFTHCSDSSTNSNSSDNQFSSTGAPGSSAEAFLTSDQFRDLQVEIDYMPGYEPTQEALDSLKTFLQARLNKSTITLSAPNQISSGNKNAYSADDIRALEEQHRDNFTQANSSTLHIYFLVVDGSYADQDNVLGIAYYNTSVAFFGDTMESTSSGLGAPPREKIEGTVFRHEFGHNMGLVGNGTPVQSDHKEEGAHCTEEGCLMEAAIETSDFFANIFDGDIPNLDEKCIQDLQENGGK